MQHGLQKIFAFPPSSRGTPELLSLMGAAGMIELVGGTLLFLGLFTRSAAFICSGFAAAAYFMAHASRDFFPILNGGDSAILYCFVFLYIAAAGAGPWSIDAMLRKGPASAQP